MGHDLNSWHLDKKVPVGIIIALIVQTMGMIYVGTTWKDSVEHRLSNVEARQELNKGNRERIVVLEQRLEFIENTLIRIEKKLDSIAK